MNWCCADQAHLETDLSRSRSLELNRAGVCDAEGTGSRCGKAADQGQPLAANLTGDALPYFYDDPMLTIRD